jgi:hypothetical protein
MLFRKYELAKALMEELAASKTRNAAQSQMAKDDAVCRMVNQNQSGD